MSIRENFITKCKRLMSCIIITFMIMYMTVTVSAFGISGNWKDYASSEFAGGSGTSLDPYLISNAGQLAYMAKQVSNGTSFSGKFIRLTGNIDLAAHYWTPAGYYYNNTSSRYTCNSFSGDFDGAGYSISNMTIALSGTGNEATDYSNNYHAFIGCITKTVRHVGLVNVDISGWDYTGALCGELAYGGQITNCYSTGRISGRRYVGGLGGYFRSKVESCYSSCEVTGISATVYPSSLGGLAGNIDGGVITNCFARGNVFGNSPYDMQGGLFGYVYSNTTITNSYSTGNVTNDHTSKLGGGLIGGIYSANIQINDCFATGTVPDNGGGLIGSISTGAVSNCHYFDDKGTNGIHTKGQNVTLQNIDIITDFSKYKNKSDLASNTLWSTSWAFNRYWALDSGINNGYPFAYAVYMFAPENLKATNLDGAKITLTLSEGVFAESLDKSKFILNNGPVSDLSIDSITRTGDKTADIAFKCTSISPMSDINNFYISIEANQFENGSTYLGSDPISSQSCSIKGCLIPSVTTGSTSYLGKTSVTIGGTVTSNGGGSITRKGIMYKSVTDSVYSTVYSSDSSETVYTTSITGLLPSTAYYAVAFAENAVGIGYGTGMNFTTNSLILPAAPVISATAGNGQVVLTWDSVPGANGYKVYKSTTSGLYNTNPFTVSESTYAVTNLTNSTPYFFKVKACGTDGDSNYSNEATATPVETSNEESLIPSVTTGSTSSLGKTSVTIRGTITSDGGKAIMRKGIMYKSVTTSVYSTVYSSDSSDIVYSTSLTGLLPGTDYYAVAFAENSNGTGYGTGITFTTSSLNIPAAPVISATAGNGQISLTWNSISAAEGYKVYMSTTSGLYNTNPVTVTESTYAVTGLTNSTPYFFKVKAYNTDGDSDYSNEATATPVKGNSGRSTGGSSVSVPSSTGVEVRINGKVEMAGTASNSTNTTGQSVTTIAVDEKKIEQKLETEGNAAVVTIPVNSKSDIVVSELNGKMIKMMENKEALVEIKTDTVTYSLPAQQIDIDAVSAQVGKDVELKDIKVQIEIARSSNEIIKVVEDSAKKGEFTIVVPPINFTVKCVSDTKTVEVKKFNAYVERTIAIPDGIDPSKITTGIVVEANGSVRHIPTKIITIDSKYYARINSLTNSTYSVVWHPIEFKDIENHWAKEAINDMGSRMVISGIGNDEFEPDRDITRAEFAAIIIRGLGLKPGEGSKSFKDINSDEWYADYIKTAYEYKIISGYDDEYFGPTNIITREQAMAMIARTFKITRLKVDIETVEAETLLKSFLDIELLDDFAKDGVAACVKTGVVSGRDGNLVAPKENITRAEVATIITRLLKKSNLI